MNEVYLDYNASAPLDPRVAEAMLALFSDGVGNASSSHAFGRRLAAIVEEAREHVASLVGAPTNRVIFTAGATEANNLALRGAAEDQLGKRSEGFEFQKAYAPPKNIPSEATQRKRSRVLVSAVEHASVKQTASALAAQGLIQLEEIPVHPSGSVNLEALDEMFAEYGEKVLLISVMAANSETGVLNPSAEISQRAHKVGALFHCDATQHAGRLPFDMIGLGVDLLSLSSHKICGPGGVGALVGTPSAISQLSPVIYGGGQESGLRSGSLNVLGIVGFGEAAKIAAVEREQESVRVATLRNRLVSQLEARLAGVSQNGDASNRLPNTANLRFAGADAEAVLANMHPVAASAGSACSAGSIEPSTVLTAMGLSSQAAYESVRFSLGRFTTEAEISQAASQIIKAVNFVREMLD